MMMTCSRKLRAALALSVAINFSIAPITRSGALAAVTQAPLNPTVSDLNEQIADLDRSMHDLRRTPYDFCDAVVVTDRDKKFSHIYNEKFQAHRKLGRHETIKQAAQTAASALADEEYPVNDPPAEEAYEAAVQRSDIVAAAALLSKLTPFEQAHQAERQHKYSVALSLYLPLADQGDVQAQERVGSLNFADWDHVQLPPIGTPHDSALAFKYFRMAAANGDNISQESLGNLYACGLGTKKNLVNAYEWFSLTLAQRAVSLRTDDVWDILAKRDFIEAEMSRADVQRSKLLLIQCSKSKYKDCD